MIIQASQNGPKLYSFLTRVTDDTEFKVITKFYTSEILIRVMVTWQITYGAGERCIEYHAKHTHRIDLIFCFSYLTLIKVLYELFIQFLRWLAYTVTDFLAFWLQDDSLSSQRDHSGHAKIIKIIFTTQLNFYLWPWFPNIHDLLCFGSCNNKIPHNEYFINNRNVLLTVLKTGVPAWLGKSRSVTDCSFDPLLPEPAREPN